MNHLEFFGAWRRENTLESGFLLLPGEIVIHQDGERHFPDCAGRKARLLHRACGLVGDVFSHARHAARFGGAGPRRGTGQRRGRAGHAACTCATGGVFGALRTGHDAARRVEDFLAQFAARKIAIHGNAGAEFVGSKQGFEGGVDLGDQIGFDLTAVVERFAGSRVVTGIGRFGTAEQIAVHIEHGYGGGREAFHSASDQVADGSDVAWRELRVRADLDQDARFGRLLRVEEDGILGKREMHARLFDFRERHHRTL